MNLPNKLTMARIIAVPIFVILYMKQLYLAAFIVFILASFTDMLDGKTTSPWRTRMFFMPALFSAVKPRSRGPLRFSAKAAP